MTSVSAASSAPDLTQRDPNRALMQYVENLCCLQGDKLLVLEPFKPPREFRYRAAPVGQDEAYEPVEPVDEALSKEALAHALWASWVYREEKYRRLDFTPSGAGAGLIPLKSARSQSSHTRVYDFSRSARRSGPAPCR